MRKDWKAIADTLHELRCDINYCKVSFKNDTEIKNTEETLLRLESELAALESQEVEGVSAEEMVKENFKGLDSLIDDNDICQFYKDLIDSWKQETHEDEKNKKNNI